MSREKNIYRGIQKVIMERGIGFMRGASWVLESFEVEPKKKKKGEPISLSLGETAMVLFERKCEGKVI